MRSFLRLFVMGISAGNCMHGGSIIENRNGKLAVNWATNGKKLLTRRILVLKEVEVAGVFTILQITQVYAFKICQKCGVITAKTRILDEITPSPEGVLLLITCMLNGPASLLATNVALLTAASVTVVATVVATLLTTAVATSAVVASAVTPVYIIGVVVIISVIG
jgi:hypothetical protein